MKFAICDDNSIDSNYVYELVKKWSNENKYQVDIETFSSAESFLFHYVDNKDYDVLLLDIEMKKMDGVSLAREIRKTNKNVQIIFITGYSEYIAEGYDVEALNYLMKPFKTEKLYEVLNKAVTKIIQNEKHLILNTFDEIIRISLHDIIYIDVDRNYTTIHSNKNYTIKMTLADIEKELDERFFRISRSIIINLKYINRVTKRDVYLTNGSILPLPRGKYESLNKAIIKEM
ncbi:MAG: LytTR family DNA-binding domain-containing protein [Acholeplasmataceae bacterium]|nr:LytTR family DNA-binding domain-containing protein [Acholeplasmataceae bacterium]